jgi:L-amino acid N-acyltransferase YncA
MHTQIRSMTEADWGQVKGIYLAGIATGNSTFETKVPSWEDWDAAHRKSPRLVIVSLNQAGSPSSVLGWAALSPYSKREVYAGVAGLSIYIDPAAQGRGLGEQLLAALIEQSEHEGIWTLQAGIFPENTASISLHEKLGFRLVGRRERIAKLDGVWRDTLLLERRSPLF